MRGRQYVSSRFANITPASIPDRKGHAGEPHETHPKTEESPLQSSN
jgi:hypothetical protein